MGFGPVTEHGRLLNLSVYGKNNLDGMIIPVCTLDASLLTELTRYSIPEKDIFEMRRRVLSGESEESIFKFVEKTYSENLRKSYGPLIGFASDIGDLVSRYSKTASSESLIDYDGTFRREFSEGPIGFVSASSKPLESYMTKLKNRYENRELNPIRDILRIRVVVNGNSEEPDDVEMCYSIFDDIDREYRGKVHTVKDRFRNPVLKTDPSGNLKPDLYKTIHLYVSNFEIQIRTMDIEDKCNNPDSVLYHPHYKRCKFGFYDDEFN